MERSATFHLDTVSTLQRQVSSGSSLPTFSSGDQRRSSSWGPGLLLRGSRTFQQDEAGCHTAVWEWLSLRCPAVGPERRFPCAAQSLGFGTRTPVMSGWQPLVLMNLGQRGRSAGAGLLCYDYSLIIMVKTISLAF